jgi:hypothetical protein
MRSRPIEHHTLLFRFCGAMLLAGALIAYLAYRQRYIGACDWFGYFELGRLLRQGKVFLESPLSIQTYPSLVPLGFVADGAHAVPQYPPGYPLLLAIAGWFGGALIVTPLIGVVSIVLIFQAAREYAERWIALAVAAMWAFFPIVVFGSTTVMSDLVAAVPVLAAYTLYRRGWLRSSALLLGCSLWVRPTNALYAIVFAGLLLRDRQLLRYVLWTLPTVAPYAAYNQFLYGAAWRTGYGSIAYDLTSTVFWPHLGFYLRHTAIYLGPLVPFVVLGLRRGRRSEIAFLVAWASAFVLFFSFWRSGGDVWWWTRFLLPGTAPLFLLASNGLQQSADWLRRWRDTPAMRRTAIAALATMVGSTILYQISLGLSTHDLWTRNKGRAYHDVVCTTDALVPAGAFVGSVEFAGAFLVYGRSTPFLSCHGNAATLVDDLLARDQPVFLIVEPWNREHPTIKPLLTTHSSELVHEMQLWGGVKFYRLGPRRP